MSATACLELPNRRLIPYALGMSVCDDAQRMLAYANGDISAFEQLYATHKDPVYRYLLRRCQNASNAEDIAQDVWSKVIRSRLNYRPDAKFTTFLYRVAHNAFIDFTRRQKKRGHEEVYDDELSRSEQQTILQSVDSQALRVAFDKALRKIPDEQRDAYLLHEEAGLTLEAIASVTGVSKETAKSRVRYAVAKLKARLLDDYSDEDA